MKQPGSLKRAVLEKVIHGAESAALLGVIAESKIPVTVVWGEQDKTIRETDQLGRLRRALSDKTANKAANILEKIFGNAGHAIPWTHARELAAFILENTLGEKL